MRIWRGLAALGLLLGFLGIFLPWFSEGSNLLGIYIQNGAFDISPLTTTSNQFLTLTYILYPTSMLIALWVVWSRRVSPWQAILVVPTSLWIYYESTQGTVITTGPVLALAGGISLAVGYLAASRVGGLELGPGPRREERRYSPRHSFSFSLRRPFVALGPLIALWILSTIALYAVSLQSPYAWYVPDIFGILAGGILGYRYYFWVAGIHDRAKLFLVVFGSLALLFIVAGIFLLPYTTATSSFNQLFGIRYSVPDIGLASSLASFGTPLDLWIGFSILFAGYKGSRTVFVRYE